ncbi:hypothetical protein ACI2JA_10250 [Alkalihalobacillus sp. NPDC078783]
MIYFYVIGSALLIISGLFTVFSDSNSLFSIPTFGAALCFIVSGILDRKQERDELKKES